jgi:hypothetical protein
LKGGFCSKLGETLPNRLAKLFFGGAEGIFSGTVTYASECGVEKQPHKGELEIIVFVPETQREELAENFVSPDESE